MNTPNPRRHPAPKGSGVACAAVVLGLATAVGLLIAGDGHEAVQVASSAICTPAANAAFAAL